MPDQNPEIDRIIEAEGHFVRSLALRLAPAAGLAEDIAQQVFLEFIAKGDHWRLEGDARALLAAMTRNVALRCWRDRARGVSAEMRGLGDHIRALAEASEVEWYRPEEKQALQGCLEKLPDRSRKFIELHYGLDVSSVEIARQMEMSAEAVRRALFRLRTQLRRCIERTLAKH